MQVRAFSIDGRLASMHSYPIDGKEVALTLQTKAVYSLLKTAYDPVFGLSAKLQEITDALALGSTQIARREIRKLESLGWVTVQRETSNSNNYVVHDIDYKRKNAQEAPVALDVVEAVEVPPAQEEAITAPAVESEESALTISDVLEILEDDIELKFPGEEPVDYISRKLLQMGKDESEAPKLLNFIRTHKPSLFDLLTEPF